MTVWSAIVLHAERGVLVERVEGDVEELVYRHALRMPDSLGPPEESLK